MGIKTGTIKAMIESDLLQCQHKSTTEGIGAMHTGSDAKNGEGVQVSGATDRT